MKVVQITSFSFLVFMAVLTLNIIAPMGYDYLPKVSMLQIVHAGTCPGNGCEADETPLSCPADCVDTNPATGCGDVAFCNPLQFDSIETFLRAILEAVVLIMFPLIVLFLVLSGFKFITAQGNPAKIQEARKLFFYTLIGALVVLGAQALSYAIEETVNSLI